MKLRHLLSRISMEIRLFISMKTSYRPSRVAILLLLMIHGFTWNAYAQSTVTIYPSKDNTIYADNQSNSNGAGEVFLGGNNGNSFANRGLIAFDIAGNIPAGAIITDVTLRLHCSNAAQGGANPTDFELHQLLEDWGEGSSNAGNHAGPGAAATTGDATWLNNFFDGTFWTTPGGTYQSTASAVTTVGGVESYSWSASGMITDVQAWLDQPAANFGWILKSTEANSYEGRRFDSRENHTQEFWPALTIGYTESNGFTPLSLFSIFPQGLYNGNGGLNKAKDASGNHFPGNIADQVTIELHNGSNYSNTVYTASNVDLDVTGSAQIQVPSVYNGSYYITIIHRNSITTVSVNPVSFGSGPVSFGFDSPAKAFGGNLLADNGNYLIYGGDISRDGVVDGSDMADIDNASTGLQIGYYPEDVNGDGIVDGSDMAIVDNNSTGLIHFILP
ncbi:MAG: DNRLRE domain-containing protein [Bacteroidetes bacterium]|nr:DNRLRE domain-containing protein [Bacteroidota bacterium]